MVCFRAFTASLVWQGETTPQPLLGRETALAECPLSSARDCEISPVGWSSDQEPSNPEVSRASAASRASGAIGIASKDPVPPWRRGRKITVATRR
jgi:hypothetical protein